MSSGHWALFILLDSDHTKERHCITVPSRIRLAKPIVIRTDFEAPHPKGFTWPGEGWPHSYRTKKSIQPSLNAILTSIDSHWPVFVAYTMRHLPKPSISGQS